MASIMGYALLKGVLKKGTSIENNINQTIASGINTAGTGIVFTLPALFMLDAKWRAEGLPGHRPPWPRFWWAAWPARFSAWSSSSLYASK